MTNESPLWPLRHLQSVCQIYFPCLPDPHSSLLHPAFCPGGWDVNRSPCFLTSGWFLPIGSSGRKWKEDGEWGPVFISLAPSLKGHLELAVLLGRRSTPSLNGLYKPVPLDSRLPPFLPSGKGGNLSAASTPSVTTWLPVVPLHPHLCKQSLCKENFLRSSYL